MTTNNTNITRQDSNTEFKKAKADLLLATQNYIEAIQKLNEHPMVRHYRFAAVTAYQTLQIAIKRVEHLKQQMLTRNTNRDICKIVNETRNTNGNIVTRTFQHGNQKFIEQYNDKGEVILRIDLSPDDVIRYYTDGKIASHTRKMSSIQLEVILYDESGKIKRRLQTKSANAQQRVRA